MNPVSLFVSVSWVFQTDQWALRWRCPCYRSFRTALKNSARLLKFVKSFQSGTFGVFSTTQTWSFCLCDKINKCSLWDSLSSVGSTCSLTFVSYVNAIEASRWAWLEGVCGLRAAVNAAVSRQSGNRDDHFRKDAGRTSPTEKRINLRFLPSRGSDSESRWTCSRCWSFWGRRWP